AGGVAAARVDAFVAGVFVSCFGGRSGTPTAFALQVGFQFGSDLVEVSGGQEDVHVVVEFCVSGVQAAVEAADFTLPDESVSRDESALEVASRWPQAALDGGHYCQSFLAVGEAVLDVAGLVV